MDSIKKICLISFVMSGIAIQSFAQEMPQDKKVNLDDRLIQCSGILRGSATVMRQIGWSARSEMYELASENYLATGLFVRATVSKPTKRLSEKEAEKLFESARQESRYYELEIVDGFETKNFSNFETVKNCIEDKGLLDVVKDYLRFATDVRDGED